MNIHRNPKVKKAVVVSVVVVILGLLGFAIVQPSNIGLNSTLVTSSLFIANAVALGILSIVYDVARKSKIYWKDAVVAALVGSVVITGLAAGFGATTFTSGLGAVYALLILIVSLFAGYELADAI